MTRLVVRERARPATLTGVLTGLALGAAAGWALGELLAPRAIREALLPSTPAARSMAELVRDAQGALAADPLLAGLALEVLPVSRQRVELHGWVPSRRIRAHAWRVACAAAGSAAVINSLLVRGEDDASSDDTADLRTA